MNNRRVLLATLFTGYNFGSSLQAYASKMFLLKMGLDCEIVGIKGFVKGRDIRPIKLLTILFRLLIYRKNCNGLSPYINQYSKVFIDGTRNLFDKFTEDYIVPQYYDWGTLKKIAQFSLGCFAGSDQIWSSTTLYVDPLYYLRFCPMHKRVAFAPSFGHDFIVPFNKKKMSKWISDFKFLSVRENSGVKLIRELTGKDAIQLIDPTLMISKSEWIRFFNIKNSKERYILAYFLDPPSNIAREVIYYLSNKLECKVIAIPYIFEDKGYCDTFESAGPIEFIKLIMNAQMVCTDSFHGTAFSINFHTPFYVFERKYTGNTQNTRIKSILSCVKMEDRLEPSLKDITFDKIDFSYSDEILDSERLKAKRYVMTILKSLEIIK
ncbi:MAG: polysaccharide pyruvyl transferase family protein [Paludibacteraceae bacterium]|nr:polysaccharide pyruvyl transferase family protein [Paludibacteraceae bacterium]